MNETRKLIESDQKYQKLKNAITHIMGSTGETEWYTDEDWYEMVASRMTQNEYHRIVRDLLDDSEIIREYDRSTTPNKTRWVMRVGKNEKGKENQQ